MNWSCWTIINFPEPAIQILCVLCLVGEILAPDAHRELLQMAEAMKVKAMDPVLFKIEFGANFAKRADGEPFTAQIHLVRDVVQFICS